MSNFQFLQEEKTYFDKIEKDLGINQSNFERKFVYLQSQVSDAYLLHRFTPDPSQINGFSLEDTEKILGYACKLIFKAGLLLKIPVSTTIVSSCIIQYFYSRRSLLQFDFRDIIMGATFLACKSEQTIRKTYQIAAIFDQLFKIQQQQQRPVRVLDPNSKDYQAIRSTILHAEKNILFQLGFQIYRLLDIPHRYIGGLLNTFDKHPRSVEISSKAWSYLNDVYLTKMCLYYPGQVIAAAAVYMSLKKLQINFPSIPWWCLMEASLQNCEDILVQVEAYYQISKNVNLKVIQQLMRDIGNKHNLVNVFPIPYYRKIMLQNRGKFRISQNQLKSSVIETHLQKIQVIQNQMHEHDKKHKKERKRSKDRRSRSYQRSRERQNLKKKQKSHKKQKKKKNHRQAHQKTPQSKIFIGKNSQITPEKIMNNKLDESLSETPMKNQKIQVQNQIKVKQLNIDDKQNMLSKMKSQLKKHEHKMQIVEQKKQEIQEPKAEDLKMECQQDLDQDDLQLLSALKNKMKKNKEQIKKERDNL